MSLTISYIIAYFLLITGCLAILEAAERHSSHSYTFGRFVFTEWAYLIVGALTFPLILWSMGMILVLTLAYNG